MLKYIKLSAIFLLSTTIMLSQSNRDLITKSPVNHSINKNNLSQHIIPTTSKQLNQKKSEEATQRLDSIIFYDKNELTGEWDKKTFKQHFFYNDNFRDTLAISSSWDNVNSEWNNRLRITRTYNTRNMLATLVQDLISKYKNKTEYSYNDNDEVIKVIESKWVYDFAKWQELTKTEKYYNSKGILQVDTIYTKYTDTDDWILKARKVYTNNIANKVIADTTYTTQRNSNEWEVFSKTEYEYNSGYLEQVSFSRWDKDSDNFTPTNKTITLYDTAQWNVIGTNKYEWDKITNQWEITNSQTFAFNISNYLNSITNQGFGETPTFNKDIFNFDYSISKNDILLPELYADSDVFHHKITNKESINKALEKYRETRYFYSEISILTTTTNNLNETISIHPNPAKESLYVKCPDKYNQLLFNLYDINGKNIQSSIINKGERINISMLSKGLYIYSIKCDSIRSTGKLIID